MVNQYLTSEPIILSGEKAVSSINGAGKIRYSHVKEGNWTPVFHHSQKLT